MSLMDPVSPCIEFALCLVWSRRCWWHAEGIKVPGGNLTNIHVINLIFMFTANRSSIFIIPLDHHDTDIVKLRQGSGKDWQGMAVKAKGVKA